ncbi:MAG: T9SS type A sorting domain-containing protein [Bacteroidetes bacterium]|nr:T9SS type A sorting domain-containing protein [Bacteroidota bacterium]
MKTKSHITLFIVLLAGFLPLKAGVLWVTSTSDSGAGSLREAISLAAPGDTIRADASMASSSILLTTGPLFVNKNLSIVGLGSNSTSISVGANFRIFTVGAGSTVLLRGYTLALGRANGAGDLGRGGAIFNSGDLTLTDIKVLGCLAAVEGGGIFSNGTLSANKCVLRNCGSPNGGAISVGAGTLALFESKLEDNDANNGAGVWFGGSGGSITSGSMSRNDAVVHGGAVYIASDATLNISRITFEDNSAVLDGGALYLADGVAQVTRTLYHSNSAGSRGGAVFVANGSDVQSENTSYSGNSAGTTGGAVHILGAFLARANTYTLNSATTDGGAIFLDNTTALRLVEGSIVFGNTAAAVADDIAFPSRLFSSSYNMYGVIDDGLFLAGAGDRIGVDPLLDGLADNGGGTRTHALLCGSPAIDSANPASPVVLDQRGLPRNFNGRSDIGAFEIQSLCLPDCILDSVTVGVQGVCDPVSNTYTQEVTVYTTNTPVTGSLIVNGQSFAVSASPQTVVLTGLVSNGALVNLDVSYSDDTVCVYNQAAAWTAAADCYSCTAQTPNNLNATFLDATNAMRLTWSPIPGVTACRISARPLGAPSFNVATRIGPSVSVLVVPEVNLVNGTNYEWFVTCACDFPPSATDLTNPSVLDTFFYDNGEPICDAASIPDNLAANFQAADSSMLLTWDSPEGMTNCRISIRPVGAPVFNLRSVDGAPPEALSIPSSDFTPGVSYEWKLRCSCVVPPGPGDQTDFSVLNTFTYPVLRQGNATNNWLTTLYPNPVTDAFILTFQPESAGDYLVEVHAADGRIAATVGGYGDGFSPVQQTIDASAWTPGAYWVRVRTNSGIQTMPFIKVE